VREFRSKQQVMNESGSAVLAVNLEMIFWVHPATLGGRRLYEP
jgi:hypothetical protein